MEAKSIDFEYIDDYSMSNLNSIIRTACAFLNTKGGQIHLILRKHNDNVVDAQNITEKIIIALKKNICILHNISSNIDTNIKHNIDDKDLSGNAFVFINIKNIKDKSNYAYIVNKKDQNKNIYIRIGGRNIKTEASLVPYMRLVALENFPLIKDYIPHVPNCTEDIIRNKVELKVIGDLAINRSERIIKYMDLEAAMLSLTNGNMRFYEPSNWEDEYECRFYNANYKRHGILVDKNKVPFLYATCMSSTKNNEAAWGIYSHKQTGLASRCVQFVFNIRKLRKQLVANTKKCSIYFGNVNYKDKYYIDHLHESSIDGVDNKDYHLFFDNFSIECYLNLLLLKRTDFEHEKEIRVFIIPNSKNNDSKKNKTRKTCKMIYEGNDAPQFTDIKIDWLEIIEGVRISANCTDFEKELLQNQLNKLLTNKKRKLKDDIKIASYEKKIQVQKFDPYKDETLLYPPLDIPVAY